MCGIGGILRVHEPGSDGHERLAGASLMYELIQQRTGHDQQDLGERPYGTGPWTIEEPWLDLLDDSIRHRGPDGCGRFRDSAMDAAGNIVEVALVHRRLSIIDHEDGAQPMVSPRGRHDREPLVAVVFNGCIYNHRELRAGLASCGHVFTTDHSDTEVLVHGWREWGDGMWVRLNAMAACAVWCRAHAALVLSRDLAGEKPISLYTPDERAMVFGSSFAGVVGVRIATEGDPAATIRDIVREEPVPEWVRRGWVSAPAMSAPLQPSRSRDLSAEDVDRTLAEAVGACIEADVPVGCFLSGGIDSALVASHAHRVRPEMPCFTVRMPDARYDESRLAARTGAHLQVRHEILDCDPHPAEDLVRLIHQLALPFGDSSILPTYWVSKAARQHVAVALAGDGADELFGGYQRHVAAPWLARWGPWLARVPCALLPQRDPRARSTKLARLVRAARSGGYVGLLDIFQADDLRRLFAGDARGPAHGGAQRFDRSGAGDPLVHDFRTYLPNDLLRKSDSASMAVALEVRSPFLHRTMIETCFGARLDQIMPSNRRKGLLKQVARLHFPDDIVDRPKMGFAIPIGEWFRSDYGGMRQLLHDHLLSGEPWGPAWVGIEGLIHMDGVRRMLDEHDAAGGRSINPWKGRDHAQRLYVLLVLSIWARWLGTQHATEPRASATGPRWGVLAP